MSISTFLKDNPMVMAGITAIVGGGTSTVIVTWLLNKVKWIPESLGNQITSFFKTNVLIKEQLMDHDGNTLAGIEAFLNSLDNKILNQNKYTKVKQIKQTIPGTYYIFNKRIMAQILFYIIVGLLIADFLLERFLEYRDWETDRKSVV